MPTVVELKAIAKSKGLKGYYKLKKDELLKLLNISCENKPKAQLKKDEEIQIKEMPTIAELKAIAKSKGLKGYYKLKKDELMKLLNISCENKPKAKLKKDEEIQIKEIVNALKLNTEAGIKLKNTFFQNFQKKILDAKMSGGSRSDHFDFEIKIEGEGWKKIEHKGSKHYKKIDDTVPWKTGVQFYNGPGSKFESGKKYAKMFYEKFIGSGEISKKFNMKSSIPSFEEWSKDAFLPDKGKSKFITELRDKCVNNKPREEKGLYKERDEFTQIFNKEFEEKDKDILVKEVKKTVKSILSEKDYWLQIHGDINNDFYSKWSEKIVMDNLEIINFKILDSVDCTYKLSFKDNIDIVVKLRWGRCKGINNLRLDFK